MGHLRAARRAGTILVADTYRQLHQTRPRPAADHDADHSGTESRKVAAASHPRSPRRAASRLKCRGAGTVHPGTGDTRRASARVRPPDNTSTRQVDTAVYTLRQSRRKDVHVKLNNGAKKEEVPEGILRNGRRTAFTFLTRMNKLKNTLFQVLRFSHPFDCPLVKCFDILHYFHSS